MLFCWVLSSNERYWYLSVYLHITNFFLCFWNGSVNNMPHNLYITILILTIVLMMYSRVRASSFRSLKSLKSRFVNKRSFTMVTPLKKLYSFSRLTEVQKENMFLLNLNCFMLEFISSPQKSVIIFIERTSCLGTRLSPSTQTIPILTKIIFIISIYKKIRIQHRALNNFIED